MRAAEAHGAELRLGQVTGITQYESRATGVEVDGNVVEGDATVIAMGPWSILAAWWLPLPAVFGLKGHSLVFDTGAKIPAEAAFLEYQERSGAVLTPELFPRTDGTTYVCAISSEEPLPVDPALVAPDPGAIAAVQLDVAGPRLGEDPRAAGVLSPGHSGRAAADRAGARCCRRLYRHRPQRLGHPQCTGDRRGDGGPDR
jgi:FAD dependent oxidoreductase